MRVLDMVCCHFRREHSVDEIKMLRCKLAFQEWRMQRLRSKIREEKLVRELLSMIITHLVKRRDSIAPEIAHTGGV
jgi:uncharacterized coiled-coil protein SlyX